MAAAVMRGAQRRAEDPEHERHGARQPGVVSSKMSRYMTSPPRMRRASFNMCGSSGDESSSGNAARYRTVAEQRPDGRIGPTEWPPSSCHLRADLIHLHALRGNALHRLADR
jgi:hypothetical protein